MVGLVVSHPFSPSCLLLFPPFSDCVQLQSQHGVPSFVPAAEGVCGPPRRDLGPQCHPNSAGGPGNCIRRYITIPITSIHQSLFYNT